ncbi:hypothetical protein CEXT_556021 [Caerostris extrusa]|uniref:Uncharacterized protein n=1 Tax=Caerostris extrusa TaxID=172846 RepID=A0AAV4TCE2_CAEEX|nr:hypothetical protein CEXT_556021 [Caerostris extrusa]
MDMVYLTEDIIQDLRMLVGDFIPTVTSASSAKRKFQGCSSETAEAKFRGAGFQKSFLLLGTRFSGDFISTVTAAASGTKRNSRGCPSETAEAKFQGAGFQCQGSSRKPIVFKSLLNRCRARGRLRSAMKEVLLKDGYELCPSPAPTEETVLFVEAPNAMDVHYISALSKRCASSALHFSIYGCVNELRRTNR